MKLQTIAYEKYQYNWMMSHGYTFLSISDVAADWFNEKLADADYDTPFLEYLNSRGFDGEIWACFEEFISTEYQDASYMEHLLTDKEFQEYYNDK